MPVEKIVLNASPLILLCNSELAFILPELFTEIVVPEAVWQEFAFFVKGQMSASGALQIGQSPLYFE